MKSLELLCACEYGCDNLLTVGEWTDTDKVEVMLYGNNIESILLNRSQLVQLRDCLSLLL